VAWTARGEDPAEDQELRAILGPEVEGLKERILRSNGDAGKAPTQFDRDEILAAGHRQAALMNRWGESSLRQFQYFRTIGRFLVMVNN
jgi:hypothetical protein